jgi:hypothetical protein
MKMGNFHEGSVFNCTDEMMIEIASKLLRTASNQNDCPLDDSGGHKRYRMYRQIAHEDFIFFEPYMEFSKFNG